MQGMGWECGCKESAWGCGESGWKYKNVRNQGGGAWNQGETLSISVEMIQNSNRDDKFKEPGEVKIIENEHTCNDLVSHI